MTIYAIDFDGTCVEHEYPDVGPDVPGAAETLKALAARGDQLILWTMRSGEPLSEAKAWFDSHNIPLFGVNENPIQKSWTQSPKAYAHTYIDDAALGCPLVLGKNRPYVDWNAVAKLLGITFPTTPVSSTRD